MKTTCGIIVMTLLVAFGGSYTTTIVGAAQSAPATATRKGIVKKVDDTTIVLVPADAKKTEATYPLSAETKRIGTVAVGDEVVVTYHYERGKVIVTAVAGKASK